MIDILRDTLKTLENNPFTDGLTNICVRCGFELSGSISEHVKRESICSWARSIAYLKDWIKEEEKILSKKENDL